MYLEKLKLKNFRKFKNLEVPFKNGVNVLIGENDSGKTAIIDSIRIILGTHSNEYYYLDEKDFNNPDEELMIECCFRFKDENKASKFLEWITFDENKKPILKIRLKAIVKDFGIKKNITSGEENLDSRFDILDEVRVTYLKPLRDADSDLIARRNSRLAQILKNHKLFIKNKKEHKLLEVSKKFNSEINKYFKEGEGKEIVTTINNYLDNFLGKEKKEDYNSEINITEDDITSILNTLNLKISQNKVGLGTLNQLYMSLELLMLEYNNIQNDFRLCLIEELEAHLHPQAQLRMIKYLQKEFDNNTNSSQLILTTHSVTLASSIKLGNLIICKNEEVFPMGSNYTKLDNDDYKFLEIFLDVTKSNLFFAKGVIFVEGEAEAILVPTIAEILGKPLYNYGISVVNIGGIAFLRYSKIFLRKEGNMNIPVSIITDLDVKDDQITEGYKISKDIINKIKKLFDNQEEKEKVEKFEDIEYLNKNDIRKDLRESVGVTKLPDGIGEIIENLGKIKIEIEEYRSLKKKRKQVLYSEGKIKVFTNEKRTLEYDLLLSELSYYVYSAIERTKGKEPLEEKEFLKEYKSDEKKQEIFKEHFSKDKSNKKSMVSKATVALNLSEILLENKEEIKRLLEKDTHVKYIKDAINYVTGEENE